MVAQPRTFLKDAFILSTSIRRDLMGDADYIQAMKKIADDGAEYAQRIAPQGETGDLRSSILSKGAVQEDDVTVALIEVGQVAAPYWAFVEYGTGQIGAASPQPDPGVAPGYAHGPTVGRQAQPYMRPTLWWLKQRIGSN